MCREKNVIGFPNAYLTVMIYREIKEHLAEKTADGKATNEEMLEGITRKQSVITPCQLINEHI